MGGLSLEACGSHLGSLSGSARPSYDPLSSLTATTGPVFPSRLLLRQRCRKVTQGSLSVLRYRSTEATYPVELDLYGVGYGLGYGLGGMECGQAGVGTTSIPSAES